MTTFTYTGPEPRLDVAGQVFTPNVPVEVKDEAVIKAVRAYEPKGDFTETHAKPKAEPVKAPEPQVEAPEPQAREEPFASPETEEQRRSRQANEASRRPQSRG